jgi:hypothetical protein
MNIEQQKERAKIIMSDTLSFIDVLDNGEIVELQNVVDTLITQTHQATIDEVVRIAEGMIEKERVENRDSDLYERSYTLALTDLIEAITSNKE